MRYDNDYFERYALLTLIKCFGYEFEDIINQDVECPDWQSERKNTGIEVTSAINDSDGEQIAIINKFFNRGMSGEEIKSEIVAKHPKYSGSFGTVNNIAYHSAPFLVNKEREKILNSIKTKTDKLNQHFRVFDNNWLYIFANNALTEEDVFQIASSIELVEKNIQFDKIFINLTDRIYVVNMNRMIEKVSVDRKTIAQLKKEAQQKP